MSNASKRAVDFIGSAHDDLLAMPTEVRRQIGYALGFTERGLTHPNAKPLTGFSGVSVMEIVARHDTNTYRGIYTVKFEGMVYVLHCFQKKSKSGIAMTQQDKELIEKRLETAREHHKARLKQ